MPEDDGVQLDGSFKLAFQMLRNANNIYHRKAIDNRYYIAFNEIQDADFDLGVAEVLMKPKAVGHGKKLLQLSIRMLKTAIGTSTSRSQNGRKTSKLALYKMLSYLRTTTISAFRTR